MKFTLLELTQQILSSLDSDEVNSINDTVESQQVAKVIRTAYFDIVARANLPEHYSFFNLDASGTSTKPTLMTVPSDVRHIDFLEYNKIDDSQTPDEDHWQRLMPLTVSEFTNLMNSFGENDTNVLSFDHTIGGSTITFYYMNNKEPDYYMLFDDNTVIFDSYNVTLDTTLQSVKTRGWGEKTASFDLSDSFTPDLDEKQFALLLNESKSLAFAELKQMPHQIAMNNARKQWINMQKTKSVTPIPFFDQLPDYGRKTSKMSVFSGTNRRSW